MLKTDPDERLTIREVMANKWIAVSDQWSFVRTEYIIRSCKALSYHTMFLLKEEAAEQCLILLRLMLRLSFDVRTVRLSDAILLGLFQE